MAQGSPIPPEVFEQFCPVCDDRYDTHTWPDLSKHTLLQLLSLSPDYPIPLSLRTLSLSLISVSPLTWGGVPKSETAAAEEERKAWAKIVGGLLWRCYGIDDGFVLVLNVGPEALRLAIEETEELIANNRVEKSVGGLLYKKAIRIGAAYKRNGWAIW